ncbi:hypothetical protein DFR29_13217 [Tahibacter aquaticus]|uniref:Uncharacterized protein n=1 Tax=Tahibacter aquaticus TaxID=520092 RepID=A0A4R6YHT3_9GAMM|nr:hypothetical protein [Tahibacter aquaticus]TDR36062.1 hypothetical protein DFR29_13217 [Tahibacter aquaticus]
MATTAARTLFASALFHHFDLRPVAAVLARAEANGQAIANVGRYEAQSHFLARLARPVETIEEYGISTWAKAHPDGVIVRYPERSDETAARNALLVQPFRSRRIEVWNAPALAAAKRSGDAEKGSSDQGE